MPPLKCEICHSTEAVGEDPRRQMSRGVAGYLCSPCVEAIAQLGDTTEALYRAAMYLDGEDINV